MTTTLTGYDAIDHAEENGLPLYKYADPTEPGRGGLTVDEAREIAKIDPSLIWCVQSTYVLIDSNGVDVTVWGVGSTVDAAIEDAAEQDGYSETDWCTIVEVRPDGIGPHCVERPISGGLFRDFSARDSYLERCVQMAVDYVRSLGAAGKS